MEKTFSALHCIPERFLYLLFQTVAELRTYFVTYFSYKYIEKNNALTAFKDHDNKHFYVYYRYISFKNYKKSRNERHKKFLRAKYF